MPWGLSGTSVTDPVNDSPTPAEGEALIVGGEAPTAETEVATAEAESVAANPTGSAFLTWTPATEYTDGSELPAAELTAYRIYHGSNSDSLSRVAEVDSGTTAFSITDLSPGNHQFAVTAVVTSGVESNYSEIGSKYVP
jgi:hypothetical protein